MNDSVPHPSLEDTITFSILDIQSFLQGKRQRDYGYHLCPSQAAYRWANTKFQGDTTRCMSLSEEVGHIFYDAAWELCRRGLLRPGIITRGKQAIDDGGYSLTIFGKQWFQKGNYADLATLEAGSLAQVLAGYRGRFGEGFHQRSQEAIRCRQAEAWLACCAMVGAASESILLNLAISKTKNEEAVVSEYSSRAGRKNVINILIGKAPKAVAESFVTFMGLLGYWRDDAAHGQLSPISVANADEALRQLLHLSQWADKNWDLLTA